MLIIDTEKLNDTLLRSAETSVRGAGSSDLRASKAEYLRSLG